MPKPLPKKQKLAPGQEQSLTIILKSSRNPPLDIALKSQSPSTSILDLKKAVSEQAHIDVANLRILHKKKPIGDGKILKDVLTEGETTLEFSIMVMGGAASVKAPANDTAKDAMGEKEAAPAGQVAQGPSGAEVVGSEEFWNDLKGFLTQRLRDEEQGEKMFGVFRKAWEASSTS